MLSHAAIEIKRESFYRIFITDVSIAQSASAQPAQAMTWLHEQDTLVHSGGGIGCNDTCGGAAIYANVVTCLSETAPGKTEEED